VCHQHKQRLLVAPHEPQSIEAEGREGYLTVRVTATPGLRDPRRLTGVEVQEWSAPAVGRAARVAAALPSRSRRGEAAGGARGRGMPAT
jgi:hypothetical protein